MLVKFISFLVHDIDNASEITFGADRKCEGNDRPGKALGSRFERVSEIGVLLVDLVDDHEPRKQEFIRILPSLFSLNFDAVNAVNYDHRTVDNAQRRPGMRHKCGISWSVDKIDLGVFVFGVGEVVVERYFSLY